MKPIRLELTDWMAHRETTLDFAEGVTLIAGPTGAGKSAILDAITFALYKQVPRLGARGLGALVRQGADRALVTLEFMVGDDYYRVAREVKADGKTTIRLEQLADVGEKDWLPIADRARDAEAKIQTIIGYTYEAFTRAAVLPQGRYAEMLTGDPARRREVLTELLGLAVYGEIGKRARSQAREATEEAGQRRAALAEVGDPEHDRQVAETNVAVAQEAITAEEERIAAFDFWLPRLAAAQAELKRWPLDWIEPERALIEEWRTARDSAATGLDAAKSEADEAESELKKAREGVERLRVQMEEQQQLAVDATAVESIYLHAQFLAEINEEIAEAEKAERVRHEEVQHARGFLAHAVAQLEAYRRRDVAGTMRSVLEDGDDCPVCGGTYDSGTAPAQDTSPVALAEVEVGLADQREAVTRLEQETSVAARHLATLHGSRDAQVQALDGEPEDLPAFIEEARERSEQAKAAKGRQEEAEHALTEARDGIVGRERVRDVAARMVVRFESAAEAPPPTLARMEQAMDGIAETNYPIDRSAAGMVDAFDSIADLFTTQHHDANVESIKLEERARIVLELTSSADIAAARTGAQTRLAQARANAESWTLSAIGATAQVERAATLGTEAEAAETRAATAEALGKAMEADQFTAYLQRRTLAGIVRTAGAELDRLSGGRYDLALTGPEEIDVIDHWGGAARPVATLSGGEIFLASMALALAVSAEAQRLAEHGRPLECLFIDEGFGTLDTEALGVIGDALARLRADGRVVGIVSHVAALAEVVDHVLRVSREPDGAVIDRLDGAALTA